MRRVWGRAPLLSARGGRVKAAAVDASAAVPVLNSIQQRGHKSGRLLASLEGGFHMLCFGLSLGQVH